MHLDKTVHKLLTYINSERVNINFSNTKSANQILHNRLLALLTPSLPECLQQVLSLFYMMYLRFCKGLRVVLTSLTADAAAPNGAPTTGGVKTKEKKNKKERR